MTDKSGSTSLKAERTKTAAAEEEAEVVDPEANGITTEGEAGITEEGTMQIEGGITDMTREREDMTMVKLGL